MPGNIWTSDLPVVPAHEYLHEYLENFCSYRPATKTRPELVYFEVAAFRVAPHLVIDKIDITIKSRRLYSTQHTQHEDGG